MNICLKTQAKQQEMQSATLVLQERLPNWVGAPCTLTCEWKITHCDRYYLMTLEVFGAITLTCQRCAEEFLHEYRNQTTLAICADDEVAESMMARYECIVEQDGRVDLQAIVTDELYLFCPSKHTQEMFCNLEISAFH